MACRRACTRPGMLQLGELGARERDPPLIRAEVHEHGAVFHPEYDAEPVRIVRHLIVDNERLGRAHRSWRLERAAGQVAPGSSAGGLHSYHHAPSVAWAAGPAGRRFRFRTDHDLGWGTVEAHCIQ
jgi:hypothetical protein